MRGAFLLHHLLYIYTLSGTAIEAAAEAVFIGRR
jgi:hypothetical protein